MDNRPSTSQRKSSRRSKSPLEDLIKCFCGACESFFRKKHIENALKANEYEVLNTADYREILIKFIEFRQAGSHIKPQISEIVDCFELCNALVTRVEELTDDRKMELEDLCFNETWEDNLSKAIEEDTLDDFLFELMIECSRRLGEEPEYHLFKEELQKKLKK